MKVQQIMTKDPDCCLPDDSVQKAAKIMKIIDAGVVPVVAGMSSEPFGQVSNGFKRECGPSELKFRLQSGDAAGVVARWS
jgi:CBS domain-containing protein